MPSISVCNFQTTIVCSSNYGTSTFNQLVSWMCMVHGGMLIIFPAAVLISPGWTSWQWMVFWWWSKLIMTRGILAHVVVSLVTAIFFSRRLSIKSTWNIWLFKYFWLERETHHTIEFFQFWTLWPVQYMFWLSSRSDSSCFSASL